MQEQVYTVKVTPERTECRNDKGQLHRLDGPAIERANGNKAWYINGKELTEREFPARTQPKELTMDEIAERFGIPVERLKIRKVVTFTRE